MKNMKGMKTGEPWPNRAIKAVILIGAMLLCGCSTLPQVVRPEKAAAGGKREGTVYVVSHGWHTGFIVPAGRLNALAPELVERFARDEYYEIGWGHAGFYRAKRITGELVVRAIFWPSDTVVHVVGFDGDPVTYFRGSEVVALKIGEEDFRSLLAYIDSSLRRNRKGRLQRLQAGLYGDSEFYDGVGKYYVLNTCNTWTAKGLVSCGFPKSGAWKLTAPGVMSQATKDQRMTTGQ